MALTTGEYSLTPTLHACCGHLSQPASGKNVQQIASAFMPVQESRGRPPSGVWAVGAQGVLILRRPQSLQVCWRAQAYWV